MAGWGARRGGAMAGAHATSRSELEMLFDALGDELDEARPKARRYDALVACMRAQGMLDTE